MPSLQFVAGIVIAIGAVFVLFGVLAGSACGGGSALINYGIAAILIGVGVALLGALPVVAITSILGVALIVVGVHVGQASGCY